MPLSKAGKGNACSWRLYKCLCFLYSFILSLSSLAVKNIYDFGLTEISILDSTYMTKNNWDIWFNNKRVLRGPEVLWFNNHRFPTVWFYSLIFFNILEAAEPEIFLKCSIRYGNICVDHWRIKEGGGARGGQICFARFEKMILLSPPYAEPWILHCRLYENKEHVSTLMNLGPINKLAISISDELYDNVMSLNHDGT